MTSQFTSSDTVTFSFSVVELWCKMKQRSVLPRGRYLQKFTNMTSLYYYVIGCNEYLISTRMEVTDIPRVHSKSAILV